MSSQFEGETGGSPHRERLVKEYDRLLAKRRAECDKSRKAYFNPSLESVDAYERSLDPYRQDLRNLLGWPVNGNAPKTRGRERTKTIGKRDGILAQRIWIPVFDELSVYGILLLPDSPPPYRFIISQHGGKGLPEMTADFFGSYNYNDMSLRVARAGYAVFAPQLFLSWEETYGSTRDQFQMDCDLKQAGSSLAALHVCMLEKVVDWILKRPDVLGATMGFSGLSYGGLYSLIFSALDTRVSAVVCSCMANDRYRYNRADRSWYGSAGKFLDEELAAMICPRPLYVEFGARDPLFLATTATTVAENIAQRYVKLGVRDRFESVQFEGGHEFNPAPTPIEFLLKQFPPNE